MDKTAQATSHNKRNWLIAIGGLLAVGTLFVFFIHNPLQSEIERRIERGLTEAGLTDVSIDISGMTNDSIVFQDVKFKKGESEYHFSNLMIDATSLPYRELLDSNYSNVRGTWSVVNVKVNGLPVDIPALAGSGDFYMENGVFVVNGALASEDKSAHTNFHATTRQATISDLVLPLDDKVVKLATLDLTYEQPENAKKDKLPFVMSWQLTDLTVEGAGMDIPALSGKGQYQSSEKALRFDGELSDASGAYRSGFAVNNDSVTLKNLALPYGEYRVRASELTANYKNSDGDLTGTWNASALDLSGGKLNLPPLYGSGTFSKKAGAVPSAAGVLQSSNKAYHVMFNASAKGAEFKDIALMYDAYTINAERLNIQLAEGEALAGSWTLSALDVSGMKYDLPPLSGSGRLSSANGEVRVNGHLEDAKKTHKGDFTVTDKTALLENIYVEAFDAKLKSSQIVIHLNQKKAIYVPLQVSNLDLEKLLEMLAKEKASGTGVVNGKVDLVIYPGGRIGIGGGGLGTTGNGIIRIDPSLLPGDNDRLAEARVALSNFYYNNVSITSSQDTKGRTAIHLKIEGNNPEAFDGRPIKLNVNLTGDVLELLQQTLLPLANPTEYLK